jgi:hypothetical protein
LQKNKIALIDRDVSTQKKRVLCDPFGSGFLVWARTKMALMQDPGRDWDLPPAGATDY